MKNVFTNIYEKELWGKGRGSGTGSSLRTTKKYIPFLEEFLKDNNIKSVIDYGCGDWQFSQHINWGDIDYLGLDIVDFVIENNKKQFPNYSFISDTDVFKYLDGRELIIIKDVIMHWPDKEIETFLDKLTTYNIWILLVNSSGKQPLKRRLKLGGFSHLEYDKFPLNKYNPELVFTFRNRQVVLIK
jgi:SAM-dependent methyltransferase